MRLLILILLFILFQFGSAWINSLMILPSWEITRAIVTVLFQLVSLVIIIFITKHVYKYYYAKLFDKEKSAVRATLVAIPFGLIMFISIFLVLFLTDKSLFAPKLEEEIYFEEYDATILVYDQGWMDPEISFKYQRGWNPVLKDLQLKQGRTASYIKMEEKLPLVYFIDNNDTVVINVESGDVIR